MSAPITLTGRMANDPELRFWAKVNKDGSQPSALRHRGVCWPWSGGVNSQGYGVFHPVHGVSVLAHRHAYELLVGVIAEGLNIDHLCRERTCVNPSHLEPVTQRENLLRGLTVTASNARKSECPQGHPYTPENTYRSPSKPNGRRCRACAREREQRRTPRNRSNSA
jgi:hypothetical protein